MQREILRNVQYITRRYLSSEIRVRFAPSPTGYLHLGGLRTALYNYLFAKSHNGKFILRIEDTDQTRLVPGAADHLRDDLLWAGIKIDEGPNIGGPCGPYNQSERLQLYKDNVRKLIDNGSAYHCFCTEKRLDLIRRESLKLREVPKYDNKCRNLCKDELNKRLSRGDKHCIRFKLLPDCDVFEDLIYGNIAYDVARYEGDPVIIKADGFPTYHFANVVDDHYMKISHVFRGLEWQISTTKHILMYRAFDWNPPQYGHLPLLINADGTKLSKRQGDIRIANYRNDGIFPLALINYITSSGGGFEKDLNGGTKATIYELPELAQQFNVKSISLHSGKLDPIRLYDYNRLELERLLSIESEEERLVNDLRASIVKRYSNREDVTLNRLSDDYIKLVLHWSVNRITHSNDLLDDNFAFLWTMPIIDDVPTKEQIVCIKDVMNVLEEVEERDDVIKLTKSNFNMRLKLLCKEKSFKFNELMKLLRMILSGLKDGPQVGEMIEILGKETTLKRLDNYISKNN